DVQGAAGVKIRRRFLAIWAAFASLPIALVAFVNYAVDPFQFFRVSSPPRFSNLMQRYQHPGVIRNYPFGSILVGNSLVGNLRTGMFDRREFGLRPAVQNLTFWGSTLREAAYVVDLSLRTKADRHRVLGNPAPACPGRFSLWGISSLHVPPVLVSSPLLLSAQCGYFFGVSGDRA